MGNAIDCIQVSSTTKISFKSRRIKLQWLSATVPKVAALTAHVLALTCVRATLRLAARLLVPVFALVLHTSVTSPALALMAALVPMASLAHAIMKGVHVTVVRETVHVSLATVAATNVDDLARKGSRNSGCRSIDLASPRSVRTK